MLFVLGSWSPEKSPARSAGVGTVAVFVMPCPVSESLVVAEEKELVAADGAAQSSAVLMLL